MTHDCVHRQPAAAVRSTPFHDSIPTIIVDIIDARSQIVRAPDFFFVSLCWSVVTSSGYKKEQRESNHARFWEEPASGFKIFLY